MNTTVPLSVDQRPTVPRPHAPRLAVLGTGLVGSAFVSRYQRLVQRGLPVPGVAWLANSRAVVQGLPTLEQALEAARAAPVHEAAVPPWAESEALRAGDIVVDATASDAVANWHPEWLMRGVHVVSANKLGCGSGLSRFNAIFAAQHEPGGGRYGDSATVGAGLPLLRSLRELIAGGDRIHAVEGVLSGSLAWLFNGYDGSAPFSARVREAREAGYTEPDPRLDLSGEDVRRKLLILGRAAGLALDASDVRVESLVPAELAEAAADEVDTLLPLLDTTLQARHEAAQRAGQRLRFVGRIDAEGASVGLRMLPATHSLCGGAGTDNQVAIFSDRYDVQPLLIQGPGAGAEVTAAALLDDVLRIVRSAS